MSALKLNDALDFIGGQMDAGTGTNRRFSTWS